MTLHDAARETGWGAATDKTGGSADTGGDETNAIDTDALEAHAAHSAAPDFVDDLEVGMALMAALTSRDMGEPVVELNLNALTPAERRAVLALLQQRLEMGGSAHKGSVTRIESIAEPRP